MAGKTKDMRKIKQVLSLKLQQESNRTIAKIVDIDKETVNNYVSRALKDPLGLDVCQP